MGSSDPILTIVIIAYNSELTIKKTFESLENQTCDNYEIVIIHALSDDDTDKMIFDFKNSSTLMVRTFRDNGKGIYDAYNQGLSVVNTRYIMFLNSDDWLKNNAVEKINDTLYDKNIKYINFGTSYYNQNLDFEKSVTGPKVSLPFLLMPFTFPATVFSTTVLADNKGFDSSYKLVADYDLILRLIKKYGYPIFDDSLVHCFRRGGRSSFGTSVLDIYKIIYVHFGFTKALIGVLYRLIIKFYKFLLK